MLPIYSLEIGRTPRKLSPSTLLTSSPVKGCTTTSFSVSRSLFKGFLFSLFFFLSFFLADVCVAQEDVKLSQEPLVSLISSCESRVSWYRWKEKFPAITVGSSMNHGQPHGLQTSLLSIFHVPLVNSTDFYFSSAHRMACLHHMTMFVNQSLGIPPLNSSGITLLKSYKLQRAMDTLHSCWIFMLKQQKWHIEDVIWLSEVQFHIYFIQMFLCPLFNL